MIEAFKRNAVETAGKKAGTDNRCGEIPGIPVDHEPFPLGAEGFRSISRVPYHHACVIMNDRFPAGIVDQQSEVSGSGEGYRQALELQSTLEGTCPAVRGDEEFRESALRLERMSHADDPGSKVSRYGQMIGG